MQMINGARSSSLALHSGLLDAARGHSHEMALRGGLDHDGADERVRNATPDPFETNGAPDDGFPVAAWCENVTYSMATAESEAAQKIYSQWHTSAPHERCMKDTGMNVAAVGIYYDGQTWWATFIAEVDNTPPGGAPPKPAPSTADHPHTTTAPSATTAADPDPVATVAPSPVGLITNVEPGPSQTSSDDAAAEPEPAPRVIVEAAPDGRATTSAPAHSYAAPITRRFPLSPPLGYGWPELLAVSGVLGVATLFMRRLVPRVERAPEMERRDVVPLPEVEPVGAGAVHV